jgi:hypothetical protein
VVGGDLLVFRREPSFGRDRLDTLAGYWPSKRARQHPGESSTCGSSPELAPNALVFAMIYTASMIEQENYQNDTL